MTVSLQVNLAPSPPLAVTAAVAEVADVSDAGQLSADIALSMGQAVLVKGRNAEVWDVVRVDCDRVQVKLRGEAIKKTFYANQLTVAEDCASDQGTIEGNGGSEPQPAQQDPVPVPTVVNSTSTQKLRVLVLDSIGSKDPGEPAGFVMVASSASLVDVRKEIKEDELEVPESFSFVVDGDLVKSTQEKKVHVEHFVRHGHVCIVPHGDTVVEAAVEPTRESSSAEVSSAPDTRSVSGGNKLPVLVGHLSKCVRLISLHQCCMFICRSNNICAHRNICIAVVARKQAQMSRWIHGSAKYCAPKLLIFFRSWHTRRVKCHLQPGNNVTSD